MTVNMSAAHKYKYYEYVDMPDRIETCRVFLNDRHIGFVRLVETGNYNAWTLGNAYEAATVRTNLLTRQSAARWLANVAGVPT